MLIFGQIQHFIASIDPAYMDLFKIFAGTIGWIGSLVLFMWWKEKRKNSSPEKITKNLSMDNRKRA
ncbi:MAG TPA: hypothetical protein VMH01_01815 [Puia sp.]|nr:hypothetical protein [Puia sp.]